MAQFQWEVTLSNGDVIKESEQKFKLEWELPGEVKYFVLKEVDGVSKYELNLENGEFCFNGRAFIPNNGKIGDFALRFFRRNVVTFSIDGSINKHIRIPHFGYVYKGEEILYSIEDGN